MAKSVVSLAPPDEPRQGAADWGEKPTNGEVEGLPCGIIGSGVVCVVQHIEVSGRMVWRSYEEVDGVVWKPTNGESDATCGEVCSVFLTLTQHLTQSLRSPAYFLSHI